MGKNFSIRADQRPIHITTYRIMGNLQVNLSKIPETIFENTHKLPRNLGNAQLSDKVEFGPF